jgi:hypothetical protein
MKMKGVLLNKKLLHLLKIESLKNNWTGENSFWFGEESTYHQLPLQPKGQTMTPMEKPPSDMDIRL